MPEFTFYTNPLSRGQIARWALHEANADYDTVFVEWQDKTEEFLKINPMGKVPTIVHHHGGHDHVITEAAAICHYLAETAAPDLLPTVEEKADYFRWLFFAAGPLEQAITNRSFGLEAAADRSIMLGYGTFDLAINTLEGMLANREYVCGNRFTMADVYVGSHVDWGMAFGSMPSRPAFEAYAERLRTRDAYKASKAIDNALGEEMQAKAQ
ncbi:glutathione S-transferase family protein [Altererythrobacter sp. FM1]|uniref:glutathione S-transferase family protein n=1 Tax=Tsuneonella flava TaxID=2055955 RepID=UPI000C80CB17|nr:glutathione S-transferase family protein [Tsuneonella flava]ROT93354.1 glutathione S-transferase family protein [Altererythrobacter sp. FM1]